MFELMEDLRAMGESNAVVERLVSAALRCRDPYFLPDRRASMSRDSLAAASAIYKEMHGLEDGTIPATFQIIYMVRDPT
jgi:NADH dehydrogenase [ubiquinone] 1 alpha subcomplex assembly factor 5